MKKLAVLFLFILCFQVSWAQPKLQTSWYYSFFPDFFGSNWEYSRIIASKDTVIGQDSCLKLDICNSGMCVSLSADIIKFSNRQIHYWDQYSSSFRLLYDFNLSKGESYDLYSNTEPIMAKITVDSIGSYMFNNRELKVQYLSTDNYAIYFPREAIEEIGCLNYLFPLHAGCDPQGHDHIIFYVKGDSVAQWDEEHEYSQTNPCPMVDIASIKSTNSTPISIYPNPAKNYFALKLSANARVKYKLYSTNGQLVLNGEANQQENRIDIDDLPSGIYSLKLISGNQVSMVKLVKE